MKCRGLLDPKSEKAALWRSDVGELFVTSSAPREDSDRLTRGGASQFGYTCVSRRGSLGVCRGAGCLQGPAFHFICIVISIEPQSSVLFQVRGSHMPRAFAWEGPFLTPASPFLPAFPVPGATRGAGRARRPSAAQAVARPAMLSCESQSAGTRRRGSASPSHPF